MMADMFGVGYGDNARRSVDDLMKSRAGCRQRRQFLLACGDKAYEALCAEADKLGLVDPAKKVAIGYCIGGGFALEQARAGADFKGMVVFHVTAPNPVACRARNRTLRAACSRSMARPIR